MSDNDQQPAEWHYEFNFHAPDHYRRYLSRQALFPLPMRLPLTVCDHRFIMAVWIRCQRQVIKCQRLPKKLWTKP